MYCRLLTGTRYFLPGPWYLGPRLSYINNIITVLYVTTVVVTFTLPQVRLRGCHAVGGSSLRLRG